MSNMDDVASDIPIFRVARDAPNGGSAPVLKVAGGERLIVHDGVRGVFVPLTGAAAGADDGNLEVVLQALREEVVRLQNANAKLAEQLRAVQLQATRHADDFATAVAHTLDTLQSRMADLSNPVSNFAVREMTIQAKVQVDVSPLGTAEYRFVQPADGVDPATLSTVALTVVPLLKEGAAPTGAPDFTRTVDVAEIQGIGEAYRQQLNARQIYTTGDLVRAATRLRGAAELTGLLGIERRNLGDWVAQARLLAVRGVDGRAAEVLCAIGVASPDALAALAPAQLVARYNARVTDVHRKSVRPIDEATAGRWIEAAAAIASAPSKPVS